MLSFYQWPVEMKGRSPTQAEPLRHYPVKPCQASQSSVNGSPVLSPGLPASSTQFLGCEKNGHESQYAQVRPNVHLDQQQELRASSEAREVAKSEIAMVATRRIGEEIDADGKCEHQERRDDANAPEPAITPASEPVTLSRDLVAGAHRPAGDTWGVRRHVCVVNVRDRARKCV
jgi:hypothetical protein